MSDQTPAPSGEDAAQMTAAATAAAELIPDGAVVGLGTGSTVAHLLPVLARSARAHRYVATSAATEQLAAQLGIEVQRFDRLPHLDVSIDGADEIAPDGWLIKGGGGAHVREKIVAANSSRFIVIASARKAVARLARAVPIEVLAFGAEATLHDLRRLGEVVLRSTELTLDNGLIADLHARLSDPRQLGERLDGVPGVVGHGLFGPELVDDVLIGTADRVEHRVIDHGARA